MLKTKNRPRAKTGKAKAKSPKTKKRLQLDPQIQARLAAIDKYNRDKEERWNALSPTQQKEEIEAWDRIVKRMNEDRKGYRAVFVDP